jgi:hypothetical protein
VMRPVEWVGRWKFLKGWTKVWSCDRHADELPWARRLPVRPDASGPDAPPRRSSNLRQRA